MSDVSEGKLGESHPVASRRARLAAGTGHNQTFLHQRAQHASCGTGFVSQLVQPAAAGLVHPLLDRGQQGLLFGGEVRFHAISLALPLTEARGVNRSPE
jgi:hypothetical protein